MRAIGAETGRCRSVVGTLSGRHFLMRRPRTTLDGASKNVEPACRAVLLAHIFASRAAVAVVPAFALVVV